MKTRRLSIIISIILLTTSTVVPTFAANDSTGKNQKLFDTQAADLYWISYAFNGGTYLMQIDSLGNVTKESKQIVLPSSLNFVAATTISKNGTDKINLWISGADSTIYRAIINKQTLTLTKIVKTALSTINHRVFKVTQKPQNNFIGVERELANEDNEFFALGVTPSGVAKGQNWLLAQNGFDIPVCCHAGSVSSDGGAAAWFEPEFIFQESHLSIQLLDDFGRRKGSSLTLARNITPFFGDVSLSNTLGTGIRFVVFSTIDLGHPDQLFLQAVNSETGLNVGNRIFLKNGTREATIDPLGRFIVFGSNKLMFQALDATGHNSGSAKILVKNVRPVGIDLLKN